jgi:hypothetical protein
MALMAPNLLHGQPGGVIMYAFGATLTAVSAAIPSTPLVFAPTPVVFLGILALAIAVGSALGIVMRTQRSEPRGRVAGLSTAVPRPA